MIDSTTTMQESAVKARALPGAWAGSGSTAKNPSRLSVKGRRRLPYLLLGVVLVAACAAGGVLAGIRLGEREDVLVLTHPVAVGQLLAQQDFKQVSLSVDAALEVVHASAAPTIVGRPIAFSVPAGSLVTRSLLGSPQVPAKGKAMVGVGLKAGQFPPDLSIGTTVVVLTTAQQGTTTGAASGQAFSWTAAVAAIAGRETEQTTVLTLLLSESDARAVASAAAGQLSVMTVSGGGR